jgi:hypothetical protein
VRGTQRRPLDVHPELGGPEQVGVPQPQAPHRPVVEVAAAHIDAVDGAEHQPLVVVADHREQVAGPVGGVHPGVDEDHQALVRQQHVVEQALPGVRVGSQLVAQVVLRFEHQPSPVSART